jgi:Fasciclin domain
MKPVTSILLCSLLFLHLVSAQFTLTEVFARYPQLSKLEALVTNSTTLSTQYFQASNYTLLAPADTAISSWLSNNVSQATVEAVLLYHLLEGRHPIASISNSSTVIKSALTNETYANVTGGQRVEVSNTGVVEFQSDAKAISKVLIAVRLHSP